MAHYAFLDSNNIVTEVIVGVDENIIQTDTDGTQVGGSTEAWEIFYGNYRNKTCKRTSRNTYGGVHLQGGSPFRKNFATEGGTYDVDNDAFIDAKPFPSWILDQTSFLWKPPIPLPKDGKQYLWNEEDNAWDEIIL